MVHEKIQLDQQAMNELGDRLLMIYKFLQFSDGRWMSFGKSIRPIVSGWSLGLDHLVQMILADASIHPFIGGFRRLIEKPDVRRFSLVAGISAVSLDRVYEIILKDDRLLIVMDDVYKAIDDGIAELISLPAEAWHILAVGCGDADAGQLRSQCLEFAHIANACFWYRCLRRAHSFPWSLCIGNIAENLKKLAAMETPPEDSTAAKIWQLLRDKLLPFEAVVAATRLLRNVCWFTRLAEQAHSHAAMAARWHPGSGIEAFRCLGFLSCFYTSCFRGNRLRNAPCADASPGSRSSVPANRTGSPCAIYM